MHKYLKQRNWKDSSSPHIAYNQDAISIPIERFKDMHSSIRFESQMS